MWVNQAFRFELEPNSAQRRVILQHIGAARFAYNWGLEIVKKALEKKEKIPSAPELHKMWNIWKKDNAPWWKDVSKCAPQEAFRDLEKGIKRWKAKQSRLPKFKKKKLIPDNSVRFTGSIRVFEHHIQIPRIGRIRSKESTEKLLKLIEEERVKILSAVISQEADRFYVSIVCTVKRQQPKTKEVKSEDDIVGVDLGLLSFAVLSDGTRVDAPKPLTKKLKILKRRSKQFSRKQKGSNNSKKAALKLARLHRKIKKHPPRLPSQAFYRAGENQASHSGRRLKCAGPFSWKVVPVCRRCGVGNLLADAGVQGEVVRVYSHSGSKKFPLHSALLTMWASSRKNTSFPKGLPLPGLWPGDGPGLECGHQPEEVWPGPPHGLYRQFGGKLRLWRPLWRRN